MVTIVSKLLAIMEAGRPLLWLFSITSAFCGMFMAVKETPSIHLLVLVAIGVGPCITTAVNIFNAVFDIEVDKLSKPRRPLPTKRVSATLALAVAMLLYTVGGTIAFLLGFWPFILTSTGIILSVLYSIPPLRFKAKGGLANLSLALGYTTICFLGGWSIFKPPQEFPFLILIVVTPQVSGANVVKDFVDYEADREIQINTLPVKYGVKKTLFIISPLFIGIYLALPPLFLIGHAGWNYVPISLFFVWGIYILNSLNRDFSRRNREKVFLHAFIMSLFTEIAFAAAYILS